MNFDALPNYPRKRSQHGERSTGFLAALEMTASVVANICAQSDTAARVIPTEGSAKPTVGRNLVVPEDFSSFLGFARNSK